MGLQAGYTQLHVLCALQEPDAAEAAAEAFRALCVHGRRQLARAETIHGMLQARSLRTALLQCAQHGLCLHARSLRAAPYTLHTRTPAAGRMHARSHAAHRMHAGRTCMHVGVCALAACRGAHRRAAHRAS